MPKHRIFSMPFATVYPLYVKKAERKNRTKEEVDRIIYWMTGYTPAGLKQQIDQRTDFETFFAQAPAIHPNVALIKGVVCGIRVEEIEDPLTQKIRYMDKLIDELAKGKAMNKILRRSTLESQDRPVSKRRLIRPSGNAPITPTPSHEDYFLRASPAARPLLEAIQAKVQALVPDASPCISYKIPAFKHKRIFFYFAAFKNHIGIYPPVKKDKRLIKELAPFRNEKGNLSFPLKDPLPIELIGRVAVALFKEYSTK